MAGNLNLFAFCEYEIGGKIEFIHAIYYNRARNMNLFTFCTFKIGATFKFCTSEISGRFKIFGNSKLAGNLNLFTILRCEKLLVLWQAWLLILLWNIACLSVVKTSPNCSHRNCKRIPYTSVFSARGRAWKPCPYYVSHSPKA